MKFLKSPSLRSFALWTAVGGLALFLIDVLTPYTGNHEKYLISLAAMFGMACAGIAYADGNFSSKAVLFVPVLLMVLSAIIANTLLKILCANTSMLVCQPEYYGVTRDVGNWFPILFALMFTFIFKAQSLKKTKPTPK